VQLANYDARVNAEARGESGDLGFREERANACNEVIDLALGDERLRRELVRSLFVRRLVASGRLIADQVDIESLAALKPVTALYVSELMKHVNQKESTRS
jgi:hypothetical protein